MTFETLTDPSFVAANGYEDKQFANGNVRYERQSSVQIVEDILGETQEMTTDELLAKMEQKLTIEAPIPACSEHNFMPNHCDSIQNYGNSNFIEDRKTHPASTSGCSLYKDNARKVEPRFLSECTEFLYSPHINNNNSKNIFVYGNERRGSSNDDVFCDDNALEQPTHVNMNNNWNLNFSIKKETPEWINSNPNVFPNTMSLTTCFFGQAKDNFDDMPLSSSKAEKNNEACRISRKRRKEKKEKMEQLVVNLTNENAELRSQIIRMELEARKYKELILSKVLEYSSRH